MSALNEVLSPLDVRLDQLQLDPNNPRFAELGEPFEPVPEMRIPEDKVQRDTFERMKAERFDVGELRDTIKTIGYLPVDRIIVRPWVGNSASSDPKYVVVEGNRRVAALKWLMVLHDTGRETLSKDQILNFTNLPALLLDEGKAPEYARLVLPGLRHISGVKEWGPYQKARAVYVLRSSGQPPREVAQSLGLSTQAANQLWRSYLALEQMSSDEEYGEFVKPSMYSYFEEIMKRPNVRSWLAWSDEEPGFTNEERRHELYSWIAGELVETESGEVRGEPKLPEARSVRELGRFIDDETALAIFRSAEGTLTRALSRHEADQQQQWQTSVLAIQSTLTSLTPDTLRTMSASDILLINHLLERLRQVLQDREKLLSS